ncbi:hypothetical protein L6164_020237 [Bauhinia variegata]|uniref:Uncharacterized protein n=1 Tax=Bauhinia variegata TaxID=167791 RepID=A0ACB9MUH7_BAUVA|nr:hypothetical protein L6164_020237 [Bauhinia variegata]
MPSLHSVIVISQWINVPPISYVYVSLAIIFSYILSQINKTMTSWYLVSVFVPVIVATIIYRLEPFEPVHFPSDQLSRTTSTVPTRNEHMRRGSEVVGDGKLAGPEDLLYDTDSGVIYTGCGDGWIKRVTVNESVAENWVNTGGRPLGLALGSNGEVIVADAEKGLLRVTKEKEIEVLAYEVEGLKFKLTDGVDIAKDGTIYFTDASYLYSLKDYVFDILEGNPHGRLMSYNPTTNKTTLLAGNLYFANGVVVSPDQTFVVVCETVLSRCRKYFIHGPKKGSIEKFIEDLPGMPDNIHYDGEGHYYIGMTMALTRSWDLLLRYPFIRKAAAILVKLIGNPHLENNAGIFIVDLEGKPVAYYHDPDLKLIASGIKIGNHIYCGSILYSYILRLDVKQYPALPVS